MILTVAADPAAPVEDRPLAPAGPDALIEEAKRVRRQRRRRTYGVVVLLVVLATVVGLVAALGGAGRSGRPGTGPGARPPAAASAPSPSSPPGAGIVGRGPTAVDFIDSDDGWVATGGHVDPHGTMTNPTIVTTTTGGQSWMRTAVPNIAARTINPAVNYYFGGLVGVTFANQDRGWYFQDGLGWQTNDAGAAWATMHFPTPGALVAMATSGRDVWALLDVCGTGMVSCPPSMGRAVLWHATSAAHLSWSRVGAPLPKGSAGYASLFPGPGRSAVVAVGDQLYRRSLDQRSVSIGAGLNLCEPVGVLSAERLAGICGVGGGGNASISHVAVSSGRRGSWQSLLGGPPSTAFVGELSTNGTSALFYVTGGQTLWRTNTTSPGWTAVLSVPSGSTDEISPVYVHGSRGLALVSNGLDAHWFETNDAGLTWQTVTLP